MPGLHRGPAAGGHQGLPPAGAHLMASVAAPAGWRVWLAGARPRTLPAAIVPVVVGTACAAGRTDVVAWRAGAAGVVALALQVGTNYANDYSDGVRGTDRDDRRVGPLRLVGSGCGRRAPSSGRRWRRSWSPALPGWRWRSPSAGSCWWSGRWPSPPAG